jgi:hypothetical protein
MFFFYQYCRLQTYTQPQKASRQGHFYIIYKSTIDDRQCQRINSLSNTECPILAGFCPALLIYLSIQYLGGRSKIAVEVVIYFKVGDLTPCCGGWWRADRTREKYKLCYLYKHGVLPRLGGAK